MKLEGYNMKTKQKEELLKAVIDRNGKRFMAKGEAASGQKMCATLGEEKALAAIAAGIATKGTGWD